MRLKFVEIKELNLKRTIQFCWHSRQFKVTLYPLIIIFKFEAISGKFWSYYSLTLNEILGKKSYIEVNIVLRI